MNKENFSLTFFVSNTLFSGSIYARMFNLAENDAIISGLIGIILGLFIIFLIHKMNFDDKKYKLIQIIIYLYFLIIAFSTLEIYISSFLLTKTPKLILIIPALSLGLYASTRDIKTLRQASYIFLWLSIISFFITLLFLTKYVDLENVLPFFSHKTVNILKSSITFGLLSSFPNILLKKENIPLKKHLKYYFFTALFNIIMMFFILGALTPQVAKIYSYPEYMVLKRIKVLDFIENIENLSVLVWYFNYFYFISLSMKRLLETVKNKVIFFLLCFSCSIISSFVFTNSYMLTMYLYNSTVYIMIALFLIISTSILNPTRHRNNS